MRADLAGLYRAAFLELSAIRPARAAVSACAAIDAVRAARDIVLGIATGKSRRGVDRLIEREGWQERFVTVRTADEHPSKPHPAMILRAMAEAGVGPGRTVMVGDTTYDMEMALAAGVGALGVAWGYHPADDLRTVGAHRVIGACDGLPAGDLTVGAGVTRATEPGGPIKGRAEALAPP
jgi:phosphoglycolate phosphatase